MANIQEPKIISGNANMSMARAIARRVSMHRGMNVKLVDARVERFNDGEIFVEVFEDGTVGKTFVEARRFVSGEAGEVAREERPNALFLVPTQRAGTPSRSGELARIVARCPGGEKSDPQFAGQGGEIEYVWYEVLDAQECVDELQLSGILKEA